MCVYEGIRIVGVGEKKKSRVWGCVCVCDEKKERKGKMG